MISEQSRRSVMETMKEMNNCGTFVGLLTQQLGVQPGETDTGKLGVATELWTVHHEGVKVHTNPICTEIFIAGKIV